MPAPRSAPLRADAVGEHAGGVRPTCTRVPPGSQLLLGAGQPRSCSLLTVCSRSCFNRFCVAKVWLDSNVDGSNFLFSFYFLLFFFSCYMQSA